MPCIYIVSANHFCCHLSFLQRNTFQVALASDGVQSYVIIEYDTIQWTGNAQIGVSSGDRFSTGPPVGNDTMLLDLTQTQVALPITDGKSCSLFIL